MGDTRHTQWIWVEFQHLLPYAKARSSERDPFTHTIPTGGTAGDTAAVPRRNFGTYRSQYFSRPATVAAAPDPPREPTHRLEGFGSFVHRSEPRISNDAIVARNRAEAAYEAKVVRKAREKSSNPGGPSYSRWMVPKLSFKRTISMPSIED